MRKRSIKIIAVVMVFLILIVGNIIAMNHEKQKEKRDHINEIVSIVTEEAESFGLKDINVSTRVEDAEYVRDFVYVTLESSNLDECTYEQMLEMSRNLEDKISGGIVELYLCNGDSYQIYGSLNSIRKNNDIVYDDYQNSDVHKEASEDSKTTIVTDDEELGALWVLAQDVVKSHLKAPSTAKFPFSYASDDVTITKTDGVYVVNAWVDSENSFGATIRTNFVVCAEKQGDRFVSTDYLFDE